MNVQRVNSPPLQRPAARTFKEDVTEAALDTGRQWAEETSTITAGAGGFSLMMLGLYGGVIGGALAGGILGGGFAGPVAAALSHGGWSFLTTGLHTINAFGAAGMVLGGACGMAGGWRVGSKLGELAGKPAFLPGAALGAVNGAADHWLKKNGAVAPAPAPPAPEEPAEERPYVSLGKGAMKNVGFIIGGMATLSGVAGGAAIGAGLATGAGLAQGLIASNLNFPTLVGGAMAGAVVGGLVLGALCFVGGMTLVDLIRDGVAEAKYRKSQGEHWLSMDKKDTELNAREQELEQAERALAGQGKKNDKDRNVRELMLKYKEDARAKKTSELNAEEQKRIAERTEQLYGEKRQELGSRERSLDERKADLDRQNPGGVKFPSDQKI